MKVIYRIVFVLLIFAINGCVSYQELLNYNESPGIPPTPQAITNYQPLILQANDILQIQISSTDAIATSPFKMSGGNSQNQQSNNFDNYLISSAGDIDFPTIGKVRLKGFTIEEAKNEILKKLNPYFEQQPIVQLRLSNFRVSINGEVSSPGSFSVNNDRVTVVEALTMAGDFTSYSKRDSILIIREQDGMRSFGYVNFNSSDLFNSPYYYLQQNDVVYVQPEKTKVNSIRDPATRFLPWVSAFVSLTALIITITR